MAPGSETSGQGFFFPETGPTRHRLGMILTNLDIYPAMTKAAFQNKWITMLCSKGGSLIEGAHQLSGGNTNPRRCRRLPGTPFVDRQKYGVRIAERPRQQICQYRVAVVRPVPTANLP